MSAERGIDEGDERRETQSQSTAFPILSFCNPVRVLSVEE